MNKLDIQKLMQQAQTMQKKMEEEQAAFAEKEFIGSAGGDLVSITMTGKHDAKKISLDKNLLGNNLSSEDKEMLEDLICAAINSATQKIEEAAKNNTSDMMSGMKMPNISDLFGGK